MLHSLFVAPNWDLYVVLFSFDLDQCCRLSTIVDWTKLLHYAVHQLRQRWRCKGRRKGTLRSELKIAMPHWFATQARQRRTSILRSALKADGKRIEDLCLSWGNDERAPCARRWRWTEDIQLDQLEVYCNFHSESEPMLFFPDTQIIWNPVSPSSNQL